MHSLTAKRISLLILLGAVLLGVGSHAVGGDAQKWTKQTKHAKAKGKEFTERRELPVRSGGTLTLDADLGRVDVVTSDTDRLIVEVVRTIDHKYVEDAEEILKHHDLTVERNDSGAMIRSRFGMAKTAQVTVEGVGFDVQEDVQRAMKSALNRRLRGVRFRVSVPRQFNIEIKTQGGHIRCGDLDGEVQCFSSGGGIDIAKVTGPVKASSSGGSLRLARADGPAELTTSGGSIHAGDIRGPAIARTSGGSINLGHVYGKVSARTSGGSIHIKDAEGAVEAVTSGGSVHARISKQPKADSYFATSGGNVMIALDKSLALDVELLGNGKASGPIFPKTKGARSRITQLNGGGPKLVAKGNVRFGYLNAK